MRVAFKGKEMDYQKISSRCESLSKNHLTTIINVFTMVHLFIKMFRFGYTPEENLKCSAGKLVVEVFFTIYLRSNFYSNT